MSSGALPAATKLELPLLLEPVKSELELVEQFLSSNLVDDSPFISELLGQVFAAGGKRIRPALVMLAAKTTLKEGDEVGRLHIILAVLTELIHTASLVHDDVIDSASTRRGQQTVNRKWSDKLAVLIGDLLFAQASVCLARLMNPSIVGIYGQVLGDLCAGEIRQMRSQFVLDIDWQSYVQKSVWKTASLFAAGCQSAPILNRQDDLVIAGLKDYGINLGICFQIIDDLLDYTGSSHSLGKPAGSDLAQGVITAPAMFVLEDGNKRAARLAELIKSRAVSEETGLQEALDLIKAAGAIERTYIMAQQYASKAKEALTVVKSSIYRDSLEQLTEWFLARTN